MAKSIHSAVVQYLRSDEVGRLSASTKKRINVVLRRLPEIPDRRAVDEVLAEMRAEGCLETTLNAYRCVLRGFGRWLVGNGYCKTDPAAHLKNGHATVDVRKRKPVDGVQASKLIEIANTRHRRDGMTVLILLATGLRESEAVGLRWKDVDFEARSFLCWRPKIRDWHTAPWSDQLTEAMVQWRDWTIERHGPLQGDWYVVPALSSRGVSGLALMHPAWPMAPTRKQTGVRERVKGWLAEVGVTDLNGKGSHTLRRSAANLLIEAGADVREAQTMLGHRSAAITEVYLSIDRAQEKLAQRVRGFRL